MKYLQKKYRTMLCVWILFRSLLKMSTSISTVRSIVWTLTGIIGNCSNKLNSTWKRERERVVYLAATKNMNVYILYHKCTYLTCMHEFCWNLMLLYFELYFVSVLTSTSISSKNCNFLQQKSTTNTFVCVTYAVFSFTIFASLHVLSMKYNSISRYVAFYLKEGW